MWAANAFRFQPAVLITLVTVASFLFCVMLSEFRAAKQKRAPDLCGCGALNRLAGVGAGRFV